MFLSVIASTGEVVIVGVVLGADPSRCTYTLIGCALSPRIGAPSIRAMIRPLSKGSPDAPIWSVHEVGALAPWRTQAEGWIPSGADTGPAPKSGGTPFWSAFSTVAHVSALEPPLIGFMMSHPSAPRLSSIRQALE